MKKSIRVHIIPTYKSNQNDIYNFFNQFYTNEKNLDLVWLNSSLDELDKKFVVSKYEIEGGEISLLSDFYFELLYNLLKIHCKKIITTTNFINFNKGIINLSDIINVNYNFNVHEALNQQIFKNIKAAVSSNKIINIKTVDISLKNDEIKNINILNNLSIKSWEIIPYFNSKDYTIFEVGYTEQFNIGWRIFGVDVNGKNTEILPQNTKLQKGFIDHINNGGKFGSGKGMLFFDGLSICD